MRQELREGERQQAPGQLCSPVSQQRADGAWRSPRDRPKRSPNHINHRLTLGSSPNRPCCTPTKSLMHRSHYRILMEDQQDVIRSPASVLILQERERKKKTKDGGSCSNRTTLLSTWLLKKRIRIWAKRGLRCSSFLEEITRSASAADF